MNMAHRSDMLVVRQPASISVDVGVRKGCSLSPILFWMILNVVRRRQCLLTKGYSGAKHSASKISTMQMIYPMLSIHVSKARAHEQETNAAGLTINTKKTKELQVNSTITEKLSLERGDVKQAGMCSLTSSGSVRHVIRSDSHG